MNDAISIQPVKLAVIDDNVEFVAGVKMLLAKEGVEVYTAVGVDEGLELVKQLLPDIVLLDVVMPGMDGVEVCKKIKQTPGLMGAYIVMLSGIKTQTDHMAEGLEAGADDYLARPIPDRELLARLRSYIRLKRTEKNLEIEKERFLVAQELSPDGFTILHPVRNEIDEIIDFTWIYENQSIARINGTDPQKVTGKRLLDLFPSLRGTSLFETYLHVANTGKSQILEEVYVGEVFSRPTWLRLVVVSMGEDIAIHSQDLTERNKAKEALSKSEEMMRNSQSVAHICAYSTNLNVNEIEESYWVCSPEFYNIFGIDESYPHTIEGWAGFIHPDYREEIVAYHETVVRERKSFNREYKIIRINDGAERWVHGTGKLEFDEKGNPVRMHGAIQDITERKQAEEALRIGEAMKNKMVSNIGDVIVIIDNDGINRYKSPNIEKWFGWKPEEVVGNSTWDNVHPEDQEAGKKFMLSLAVEPNASDTIELRYRKKDGSYCPIEITVSNLLYDPVIQGFLGNYHDISERKKAAEALRESQERFQLLFNKAPLGYQSLDFDGHFIEVNQQWLDLLGYAREEVIGKWFGDFLTPAFKDGFSKRFPVFKAQGFIHSEFELVHKDGKVIFIAFDGKIGYDLKGDFKQTHCILKDITDRKKAEEALRESEERFKALHNASFGGITIHDKGLILECNQGLSEITGYSYDELIGMEGLLLIAPEKRDMVKENILAGYEKPYEAVGLRKNGELYPLRLEARNIPYKGKTVRTVEFRDITESKQAQEALQRIEWMLSKNASAVKSELVPPYGDLSAQNTNRLILDSVGPKLIREIANDYLSLMDTSSAIYEKNGDYVLGIFASGWCRLMDQASRELCNTADNNEALNGGKWLCHDSCWKDASQPAMKSGQPVDIECQGGIHLYALPIVAGNEIVGAISFGYGDPPQDKQKLSELSEKYRVPLDELIKKAKEYQSRPSYIIETAKNRLQASANLIGEIVSRKIAEKEILTLNDQLEQKIEEKTRELKERISELERFHNATIQREFRIKELREEIEQLKSEQ